MRVRSALRAAGLAITLTALAAVPGVRAQQGGDNPPEILTSDLALKTVLESDRLEVNFVIVDTDKVTRVTIDGQEQSFEPADTVMLTRNFVFTQDVTRVRVSATDEAGHTRNVVYTVFRPGVSTEKVAPVKSKEGRIFAKYDVRLEYDSNPSQETSSPIKVAGISKGNAQPDTRATLDAYGGYTKGNLAGFAGGKTITYSDSGNEPYELQAVYFGGILALPRSAASAFELSYLFVDVNVGKKDYEQQHTLGAGYRSASVGAEGGTETTLYRLDVNYKDFSNTDLQKKTTVFDVKWEYNEKEANKLDEYHRRLSAGTESEGTSDSAYNFLGGEWEWNNRWDSGLLFDLKLSAEYRRYRTAKSTLTDKAGQLRTDIPMIAAPGIGWQFSPALRLVGHFDYKYNLSNDDIYARWILGIGLDGKF